MNRWYFWVLAPVFLVTAISLPLLAEPPSWLAKLVIYAFSGLLLVATLGLASPLRFHWAFRIVAAAIFLTYSAYATFEFLACLRGKSFGMATPTSESNLRNALLGLFMFGIPSLFYSLKRRSKSTLDTLSEEEYFSEED